eukprot:Colp12_sorted_trinity150504_noHs@26363
MTSVRQRRKRQSAKPSNTRKKGTQNKHFRKVVIKDETIAKQWDKGLTLKQNFEKMGLAFDPNAGKAKINKSAEDEEMEESPKEPTALVKELEEKAAQVVKIVTTPSEGQAKFVQQLIAKHGTDYKAMSRDLKLNTYQHTAKKLKAMCEKFLGESAGGNDSD